ncbi:hypothetical protein [Chryseobacterium sp. PMSZPI]|uniref:hypothetical protein n=1 Tax=Chryseobacterium sp. PMSZPI TaxID=1033900 RepID=UPI0010551880|nr:hypothetical protein [Chryseobacterium sp. PMSZPI]
MKIKSWFKKYKYQILIIFFFLLSLCFNALVVQDYDGIKKYSGLELFLSGFFAFLGGGIFETLVWSSNILALNSLFFSKKYPQIGILFSFLAFGVSISFIKWNEILVSESGRNGKIIELDSAYWIWIFSILLLNILNLVNLIVKFSTKNKKPN